MKKLFISLFVILFAIGCTQVSVPECEQDGTFSMEFTNSTGYSYDLYINDDFQQKMSAKSRVTYDIPAGYWSAEMVQRSGYEAYPNVFSYSETYEPCTNYYIVF
jgi:hypothetical protein